MTEWMDSTTDLGRGATVLVVGAGFSGTVTAANLLRRGLRDGRALRVLLVERARRIARGVAYGTRSAAHVLNVPAGRMSAYDDDEDHFLRFARAQDYSLVGGSFVPRALYGEYLEHLLDEAERAAARGATLERVTGEVVDIEPIVGADDVGATDAGARGAIARFADGRAERVDRVVLAVGNHPPADPAGLDPAAAESPRYVRDPWARGALERIDPARPVLLIGTGLTALDVALDLHTRGMRAPIVVVSRRGLLPLPHRASTAPPTHAHAPADIERGPATAAAYLRAVRAQIRRVAADGIDWRDVVSSLRPITPALWRRLPPDEQRRFLRHVRPYWETHRHRAAPLPHAAFERLRARGDLRVIAGRFVRIHATHDALEVQVRHRASGAVESLVVAHAINCTGPASDPRRIADPLIAALLARGLARPDALALGLDTSERLAPIDANGAESSLLLHVGPMLRGRFWEATAVPELRTHARRVAEAVIDAIRCRPSAICR
jgi:uncharacterized NAD(P)/FAD-binding protein YdhS